MSQTRARELLVEVIVGAFMFAVLAGLAAFTILLSRENIFRPTHAFEVVFDDVIGLRDGDNIVIRGMTVGKVKALILAEDGVHVLAALQRELQLKTDYRIDIVNTSILGGRYLQIYEGSPGAAPLPPGTPVRGVRPYDLIAVATAMIADLKDMSGKISSGEGTLGKLVTDPALYNDLRDIASEIKTAVKDRGLVRNLEQSISNLNEIAVKVNSGQGTLGKLVNDDSLYVEVKKTVSDVRAAVDDLRETSPIVTFSSIFFGVF